MLAGIGEMLQAGSRRRIYWVHAVWVFNVFIYLVIAWWVFYRWRAEQHWTFFLFVFVLISPTILYLAALLLFPPEGTERKSSEDYRAHFYANHRGFFILFALFVPVDIVDTLFKGVPHFVAQGPQYIVISVLMFGGMIVAAITRNERYHGGFAIYFLCQTVTASFVIFHTLM